MRRSERNTNHNIVANLYKMLEPKRKVYTFVSKSFVSLLPAKHPCALGWRWSREHRSETATNKTRPNLTSERANETERNSQNEDKKLKCLGVSHHLAHHHMAQAAPFDATEMSTSPSTLYWITSPPCSRPSIGPRMRAFDGQQQTRCINVVLCTGSGR